MNQEYTRAPHRRPSEDTPQHSAALLIDFDNVTMGIRSNLGLELRNLMNSDIIRGKVAVQRAYADWRRYPQYIVPLSEASIDLIFAPAYGSSKKNATDIRLAIDALELVFIRPEIGTYILLSGDSDFSALVLKLKEYGKYVIGVGLQESTSDILVQNCDEYYSYNRLSGLTSAEDLATEKHDPWELVQKAVTRMAERGDVMRSDRLKQVMLEMDASFNEKTAGFTKFNRFLAEAAHRDLIRMRKGENGQYEVSPGKGAPVLTGETDARSEPRSGARGGRNRGGRGGRSGGRGRGRASGREAATAVAEPDEPKEASPPPDDALQVAYAALASVVGSLHGDGSPVRDSMSKRKLLERDRTFDEGSLGFRKYSEFLKQADADGIVSLEQGEDGNYYLTPGTGAAAGKRPRRSEGGPSPEGRDRARPSGAQQRAPEREEPREDSVLAQVAKMTLGRFRRGSKTAPSGKPEERPAPQVGPVEEAPAATAGRPPAREEKPRQKGSDRDSRARRESSRGRPRDSERPGGGARQDRQPRAGAESPDGRSEAGRRQEPRGGDRKSRERGEASRDRGPRDRGGESRDRSRESKPRRESKPQRESKPRPESKPAAESRVEPATKPPAEAPPAPAAPAAPRLGRRTGSRGRGSSAARPAADASATRSRIGPVPDEELGIAHGAKPEPEKKPDTSGNGAPAAPTAPMKSDEGGPVSHMVQNYAGVGKRTAEILYDRFGDGIFDVIDNEPSRITEVLSEGRAKAVIDARRKEREA